MTVSDQVIQVLDALCEKFGLVFDWTSDNVIPYITTLCGRLISYEICTSVAWIVIMLMLGIGSILAARKLYPYFMKKYEECGRWSDWDVAAGVSVGLTIVFNVISIFVCIGQMFDIIKCSVFPELFVIEYIQDLIESASRG